MDLLVTHVDSTRHIGFSDVLALRAEKLEYYRVSYDLYAVEGDRPGAPVVALEPVANRCGAGDCPTVFRTDRGTLVVQGYTFQPAEAGVALPPGEQMVEIPIELLADYAKTIT